MVYLFFLICVVLFVVTFDWFGGFIIYDFLRSILRFFLICVVLFVVAFDWYVGFIIYNFLRSILRAVGIGVGYQSVFDPPKNLFNGKLATVQKTFQPTSTFGEFVGKVSFEGAFWTAVSSDGSLQGMPIGSQVEIIRNDGVSLVVKSQGSLRAG